MNVYSESSRRLRDRFKAELPQGVLLIGPDGVGLGTMAQTIAQDYSTEVMVIRPEKSSANVAGRGTISIERIRELYSLARSKSTRSAFIIDDADTMGIEAQNAFLKLLEEPVEGVKFILTSHAGEKMLPTVSSRVETHTIARISREQTTELFEYLGITDPTKRAQLSFIADGLPAAIARYAADEQAFTARSQTIRDARTFLSGSREDRLLLINGYKDRTQALAFISDITRLLKRSIEAAPKAEATEPLERMLDIETALYENASVRLSLIQAALLV